MDAERSEGGDEELEMDAELEEPGGEEMEMDIDADISPEGGEEVVADEEEMVAEVARRVAARLMRESRRAKMADTLTERIMKRLLVK